MKGKYETVMMYLIYFVECTEKVYVKIYPYAAAPAGFIIFIGLVGRSEHEPIDLNYTLSVIIIFLAFTVLTLLWKVGNLKLQRKERESE